MTAPRPADPRPPAPAPAPTGATARPASAEPTPWATGLTATAMVTALVAVTDVLLSRALWAAFGWVWLPANLLVGLGLAPSIWLLRRVPFWRWIAYGVALGLGLAWAALVLGLVVAAPAAP